MGKQRPRSKDGSNKKEESQDLKATKTEAGSARQKNAAPRTQLKQRGNNKRKKEKKKKKKTNNDVVEDNRIVISKDQIQKLPAIQWNGPIRFLNKEAEMKVAVGEILKEMLPGAKKHTPAVLGFDTETRPVFVKGRPPNPTALIQIATKSRVYLFHVCKTRSIDPLLPIFTNRKLLKVGVSIHQDVKELQQTMVEFKDKGFCDITDLTNKSIKNGGLQALTAHFLKKRITKSKGTQLSNWENNMLTERQMRYAATDAWAGREVYLKAKEACNKQPTEATAD